MVASLLSPDQRWVNAQRIEVSGGDSSGEVEFVLYALDDAMWIGVGSDHTDRKAETINVTLSKQMCGKPVSPALWRYDEVKPHWDKLTLRSFVPGELDPLQLRIQRQVLGLFDPDGRLNPGKAL
mgnify:CR=1 FL=1